MTTCQQPDDTAPATDPSLDRAGRTRRGLLVGGAGWMAAAVAASAAAATLDSAPKTVDGGAMPEPGSTSPLWVVGLLAFLKLSIDAVVINAWGRRHRRRAMQRRDTEDFPRQGGR